MLSTILFLGAILILELDVKGPGEVDLSDALLRERVFFYFLLKMVCSGHVTYARCFIRVVRLVKCNGPVFALLL